MFTKKKNVNHFIDSGFSFHHNIMAIIHIKIYYYKPMRVQVVFDVTMWRPRTLHLLIVIKFCKYTGKIKI